MIDNRFGYGTWRQIVNERAKRIQEEKERIREEKRKKRQRQEEIMHFVKIAGFSSFGIMAIVLLGTLWYLSHG